MFEVDVKKIDREMEEKKEKKDQTWVFLLDYNFTGLWPLCSSSCRWCGAIWVPCQVGGNNFYLG